METYKYELAESKRDLVQMIRIFERKLFTSYIQIRNNLMRFDYCTSEPHPVIATQLDYLIILTQELKKEFKTLSDSQLATENHELFFCEVRLSLTRLEDEITTEITGILLQNGRPKELIKKIYQDYTHYLKEVIQHIRWTQQ